MDPWFQNLVSLLVVTVAGAYLLHRGVQFYLSLKTKSGSRCGGCSSCGTGEASPYTIQRKTKPQITQITQIKDIESRGDE